MGNKYRVKNTTFSRPEDGGRVTYEPGDIVENLSDSALKAFADNFELIEEEAEEKEDIQNLLDEFHTGGGWYDIPGIEKNLRKEDAIEALEEGD